MKKFNIPFLMMLSCLSFSVHAETFVLRSVETEGLKRVEKETVLAYLGLKTGQTVSDGALDKAFKNLYATGLFSDIQMNGEKNGVLKIEVKENPLIGKRVFDGNKKLNDKTLESEVSSKPNSIYNKSVAQQDAQRILELYKKAGRYNVSVEPKIIERKDNRVDLIFEIDEGGECVAEKQKALASAVPAGDGGQGDEVAVRLKGHKQRHMMTSSY